MRKIKVSESGRLRRVVMCPPANFHIVKPINAVQWLYYRDGLPPPQPWLMVEQHSRVVEILRQEGVEVELLPPVRGMPFQHATRDIGVVVGDTIVANPRIDIRQQEVAVAQPVFGTESLKRIMDACGSIVL